MVVKIDIKSKKGNITNRRRSMLGTSEGVKSNKKESKKKVK